jgi:mannose-6-phosphate isomerase-like protein (cupin superfamily)
VNEPVFAENAEHYTWGKNCDGWHMVRTSGLSVIQERMPPGSSEVRHSHKHARQFFYVLQGEAVMEVDGMEHRLMARYGLEVAPGTSHRIFNRSADDLHLLVISQPPSHGDRIIIEG